MIMLDASETVVLTTPAQRLLLISALDTASSREGPFSTARLPSPVAGLL